jgi:hypothetical protein
LGGIEYAASGTNYLRDIMVIPGIKPYIHAPGRTLHDEPAPAIRIEGSTVGVSSLGESGTTALVIIDGRVTVCRNSVPEWKNE